MVALRAMPHLDQPCDLLVEDDGDQKERPVNQAVRCIVLGRGFFTLGRDEDGPALGSGLAEELAMPNPVALAQLPVDVAGILPALLLQMPVGGSQPDGSGRGGQSAEHALQEFLEVIVGRQVGERQPGELLGQDSDPLLGLSDVIRSRERIRAGRQWTTWVMEEGTRPPK